MKISVVGMGKVGTAAAFALVTRAVPHELVLVGRTKDKAVGEAHDLLHASALVRPMRIVSGDAADTAGSDIVLLAVSAAELTASRLDAAGPNAKLLREVVPPLAAASPDAVFVVLTNPVDVATYVTLKASGFAPGRVMGTGTLLDTARLRALLSRQTGINAVDIRAYVLGEHGDSQFAALSVASVGGLRIDPADPAVRAAVDEARGGGYEVARHKGYTNHAVAVTAALICEAVANDERSVLPVSTLVDSYLGVRDVCLSLPCVVGAGGVSQVLSPDLSPDEADRFRHSAAVIRGVLDGLG